MVKNVNLYASINRLQYIQYLALHRPLKKLNLERIPTRILGKTGQANAVFPSAWKYVDVAVYNLSKVTINIF